MRVVLDANIYLALFTELAYSQNARAAVAHATEIIAPDLIRHETANTLWKLATAGAVTAEHASQVIAAFATTFDEIVPMAEFTQDAFQLATRLNHPAYDCYYLHLAMQREATLVTADKRLAQIANSLGPKVNCLLIQK